MSDAIRRCASVVLLVFAALIARSGSLAAAPIAEKSVPPELLPWVPWVLDSLGDEVCPVVSGDAVCLWPGELSLRLDDKGGTFEQRATSDRRTRWFLPGSDKYWPDLVRLGGKAVPVLSGEGKPYVDLPPGEHIVVGRFSWARLPDVLDVPPLTALLKLVVAGVAVPFPKRAEDGSVWLRDAASGQVRGADAEPERLELEVFRRIDDGVPVQLTTRLRLRVSGRAREVNLGNVLLEGSRALALESPLSARLDGSRGGKGELTVQVRPGEHRIVVRSLFSEDPALLKATRREAPWPEREVWVFVPNTELRQVELHGAPHIDPSSTNLDADWRAFGAYAVEPGQALKLVTSRRGEASPAPNRLNLTRELWLDLDGAAFTVRDTLNGDLTRGWRLDLLKGELGRVSVGGEDQLITTDPAGHSGVELRRAHLSLSAESRLAREAKLPAVGWSENVERLAATLHLPPGWDLFHAQGVDEVSGTWVSRWDLFDVFFVLVVGLGVGRLTRIGWGIVALGALTLCHGYDDAPRWLWIVILVSIALFRVIPTGWLRRSVGLVCLGTAILLAINLADFCVTQVKVALFPQIRSEGRYDSPSFALQAPEEAPSVSAREEDVMRAVPPPMAPAKGDSADEVQDKVEAASVAQAVEQMQLGSQGAIGLGGLGQLGGGSGIRGKVAASPSNLAQKASVAQRQDPNAVIQTGPGVPRWSFSSWALGWHGPVDKAHELRLVLLSPTTLRILTGVRLLLLGLLAWVLFRVGRDGAKLPPRERVRPQKGTPEAAALALGIATLLLPGRARAEVPREDMLSELRARLIRPAECQPECVSVSALRLSLGDRRLEATAEVHAGALSAYQVPGPAKSWVPEKAFVDGKPSSALVLRADGFLYLRLTEGRHEVRLEGPIAGAELVLNPGTRPHRVEVKAPDWDVDGVNPDGLVDNAVQLIQKKDTKPAPAGEELEAEAANSSLPPWLEVTRTLNVGVVWSLHTRVVRVSPAGTPVVQRFALLPGENVTTEGALVDKDGVLISLSRDQTDFEWTSTLPITGAATLTAARDVPWSELWIINCGPVWHCSEEGLAPFRHQAEGQWQPHFRPWPGEALSVRMTRPLAAAGASLTVDNAKLALKPGTRLLTGVLELDVRSSTTSLQEIRLPKGARVHGLSVDGVSEPVREEETRVPVSVRPGAHHIRLEFQEPRGLTWRTLGSRLGIGAAAANAEVSIELPDDRWLLYAGGPSWGPAILFWGYLILIAVAAVVLGRLARSPLRVWQWALLGLGLTQVPVVVAGVVAAWFFAMSYRGALPIARAWAKDALQVALVLLTFAFLGCLAGAVYEGLVTSPDVMVVGAGSSSTSLRWYVDRVGGTLPEPWVVSAPLWVWRVVSLAWALWLAVSLLGWLRWGFGEFVRGGAWAPLRKRRGPAPAGQEQRVEQQELAEPQKQGTAPADESTPPSR